MFRLYQQQHPPRRLQAKVKLKPHRFVIQIEYRGEGQDIILGYIGEFNNGGKRIKKFWHNYKATLDGVHWSTTWMTYTGAINYLLERHGKPTTGMSRVIPHSQTFIDAWKPLDFCEEYNKDNR